MKRPPIIIVDCNFLCYQALYTMGDLAYGDDGTGVVFGFLSRVLSLGEFFKTNRFYFAWDSKSSIRRKMFPAYKASRLAKDKDMSKEEKAKKFMAKKQFKILRKKVLPAIGFGNVFVKKGYEGDDIIANLVLQLLPEEEAIIISADEDLFQLLSGNVRMFNPTHRTMITVRTFKDRYGLPPELWSQVKTLAGCKTDGVPGIPGIGEGWVLKFLKGEKMPDSKHSLIAKHEDRLIRQNKPLVALPLNEFCLKIKADKWDRIRFRQICEKYGFDSFIHDGGAWNGFFKGFGKVHVRLS